MLLPQTEVFSNPSVINNCQEPLVVNVRFTMDDRRRYL